MLTEHARLLLAAAFCPYLGLALYDGWLHESARKVPMAEQVSHAAIALAVTTLLLGVFTGRAGLARLGLIIYIAATVVDEGRFHGALPAHERRLHFLAYACFAAFVGAAWALGAFA